MENKIRSLFYVLIGLVFVVFSVSAVSFFLFGSRFYNGSFVPAGMSSAYGFVGIGLMVPIMAATTFIFILVFLYFIIGAFHNNEYAYHYNEPYRTNEAERIAKERFARGEITEAEYTNIIDVLRKSRTP